MGALHEGHIALVREARIHADRVAVSIFVNPLQFNDKKDLLLYPRHPQEDLRMLREAGCAMVLMPQAQELFRDFTPAQYDLDGLDSVLEGASRPGHFQGVVNVVERLFHYVRPDIALFGEKDRQQLAVLKHAATRQRWPVQIIGHPIVRAADGLALSSRNQRLSARERQVAPVLHQALQAMAAWAFTGSPGEALQAGMAVLANAEGVKLDYLTIADPVTLQPVKNWELPEAVALVAAQVGPVRLIDNITLHR